ncbi:MAG TPA: T9SS type A sorting domain-containing protein [Rhodothermales bacterium]|nr:T9SS type A sorting domain-containing protein [Rhodothermales bacterium]
MHRSQFSVPGFVVMSIILAVGLLAQVCLAQSVVKIDPFDWATPSLSVMSPDSQDAYATASKGVSISNGLSTLSSAFGGESDGVLTLVDYSDHDEATALANSESGLHITSSDGSTVQFILTLDGKDGDPVTLHASDGIDPPLDFTGNGTLDSFTFHGINNGPPATVALVAFSSAGDYSEIKLTLSTSSDEYYEISFDDLTPTGQGADMTAVTAFALFFGADGGAPGPVDFQLQNFSLGQQTREQNSSTDEVVIVNQFGAPFLREVWANDFGADPQLKDFSSVAAEDFVIGPGDWQLVSGRLGGTYFQNVPDNPTMDVVIYSDDNGRPGSNVIANYTLPIDGHNPFRFRFPENAGHLSSGKYWIGYALNSNPGEDGFFRGSGQEFGDDAVIRNPGGRLGCGTDWTPLRNCENGVRSLISEIVGRTTPRALGDVKVEKVTEDTVVVIGDTLTFTITVTNQGEIESLNAVIEDFYDGAELVSIEPSQGTCDESGDVLLGDVRIAKCQLGLISPGEWATVVVKMIATVAGKHRNIVHFVRGNFPDIDASNDWADAAFNVDQLLTVTKDAPQDNYLLGQIIPFKIAVRNETFREVSQVEIFDSYVADNFAYVRSDGNCEEPELVRFGISEIKCEIGSLGPGEEHQIVIEMGWGAGTSSGDPSWAQRPAGLNRVEAFSSRGFEARDEFGVDLPSEYGVAGLLIWAHVHNPQAEKRSAGSIDVYLNDALLADDIAVGEAIRFQDVPVSRYPFYIYLVPSESEDRASAFDSLLVESLGVSSGIVLTVDSEGNNQALLVGQARYNSENPNHVDMAVIHAAATLPALDVTLMTEPEPTLIAEDFAFGQTSTYAEIETPGAYNLVLTPDGNPDESEVFRLELTTPGEAYMVVIAPEPSAGKLDGITVYAVDSQGNVVQPAVVTSTDGTDPAIPTSFALHGNYPNPFNPATTIAYDLPKAVEVNLVAFDGLGRIVESLVAGHQSLGRHSVLWETENLPSGVYFVRMEAGSFVKTRKMVLLK